MDKKENITIKDIATACAVGLGSVSRAINGKPGVKPEVRRKILAYINDIGWSSSSLSGRLNSLSRKKLIVFTIPQFGVFNSTLEFVEGELLDCLLDACIQQGYETLILAGNRAKAFEQCRKIHPWAIIQPSSIERLCPLENELCASGIRLITLSYQQVPTGAAIHPDYEAIGSQLARSLYRAGHRKIAFLGGMGPVNHAVSIDNAPTKRLRMTLRGIADTLPEFIPERDLFSDNHANPITLDPALQSRIHTAWICDSWKSCALFLRATYKFQLDIPRDVSVVSIAPGKPDYIFPMDISRSYLNLNRCREAVMTLLDTAEPPTNKRVICPNLFHKGGSISIC